MPLSILKIFTIFGIVSTWAEKAFKDNVVTLDEGVDLLAHLARALGVRAELEIPGLPAKPPPLIEEVKEEQGAEAPDTIAATSNAPPWAEKQPPKPESKSKP